MIRKIVSQRFTRHLLHKSTIPRLEDIADIADLPNRQRQTQKGKQNETKKPALNERTGEIPRKRTK